MTISVIPSVVEGPVHVIASHVRRSIDDVRDDGLTRI